MNKNQDQPADAAELCRRAEERLSEKQKSQRSEGGEKRPAEDTARLVHELQAHQIELEMQNEELRQARAKADGLLVQYTDLYDFAPTGYMNLDREGAIRQVNLTGARLFGVERSRLVNRRLGLFLAEGDRRAFHDFLEKVFASQAKECCEVTLPEEGSQPLVMRIEGTRSADGQECRAVVLEITERKRAEEALRESEERYRRLFEEAPIAYHEIDRDGVLQRVNRAECELLGYAPEEMLGRPVWEFVVPEQRDMARDVVRRKLAAPYQPVPFHREWLRRDGGRLVVEMHENVILDSQGQVSAIRTAVLDITERQRAEEALRDSEQFLSSVFAGIQDGLSVLDTEFNIVRVNPAMERWLAHAMPLVGKKCWQAYHGRTAPCESCPSRRALETGAAAFEVQPRPGPGGQSAGWLEVHSFPLLNPGTGRSSGVIECVRDITEHRRLEEQFRQAQKMEAVGRLAGGIAHDFNNLLMVIRGYSDLLLEKLKPADSRRRALEEIRTAGERAATLTLQLLAFSRKQVLQPQILDLNAVVSNINTMLRRLIGEDIELTMLPGAALDRVQADPGQVEQVIMNLAVNARDAMPHGGKLTIETANVNLDEDYARRDGSAAPGPYVRLSVSDTGCGMDAETQARIFEPFFTTKERGKGTGLGLATVYGIVKQSGGHIWVYSEVGRGTVFKIYLPRAPGSAEVRQQGEVQETLPGGVETVLVAEDDPAVRALVCGALANRGYTVQEARDGREALAAARGYKGPIHLLLTDVVLPHMSGRRLAERLLAERPESRLLYMSGYTDDAVVNHGVSAGNVPFLQKPFSASALNRKVREVLDQPSPGAGRKGRRPNRWRGEGAGALTSPHDS